MRLRQRIIFLFIFLTSLILIGYFTTRSFAFLYQDFWFASGLLLLVLMSLVDQPFFSTDANVFMNGTAGLSLILVDAPERDFFWHIFLVWCVWLMISSYGIMGLTAFYPSKIFPVKKFVERINREIGKPAALFSAFFIWGAIHQFGVDSPQIKPLFIFWVIFTIFNIPAIARAIDIFIDDMFKGNQLIVELGELFRVSDPRLVEVKLNHECPEKIIGKIIEFTTDDGRNLADAFVIDDRVTAGNRIAKVAITKSTSQWSYIANQPKRTKIKFKDDDLSINDQEFPISIVDVGSSIGAIKFVVHPDINLRKGEIVWTNSSSNVKVYYQVTSAQIIEQSVAEGNVTRSVLVTASQIGIWNEHDLRFEQYSWIPPAGHLVLRISPETGNVYPVPKDMVFIGNIPNSKFPVLAKINDLVTHNTAIIGVTGSGKSYLTFNLIEAVLEHKIKVFIFDLTKEYSNFLWKHKPTMLNSSKDVATWYESESLIGIHQFEQSNNYTRTTRDFSLAIFNQLKNIELKPGTIVPARMCLVFEEAHSLIPEWNQVAEKDDTTNVNSTARTILQGRKYGIGSFIITQRTANVTKTILNQCNTMIALRSFDQTGLDFLSNYMGTEYSQAISTLQARDAIIVGKSSSSQSPLIFTIPDFSSRWTTKE